MSREHKTEGLFIITTTFIEEQQHGSTDTVVQATQRGSQAKFKSANISEIVCAFPNQGQGSTNDNSMS